MLILVVIHRQIGQLSSIIKIMPCVEGDRSDCQPEASFIARSRRLSNGWLFLLFLICLVYFRAAEKSNNEDMHVYRQDLMDF